MNHFNKKGMAEDLWDTLAFFALFLLLLLFFGGFVQESFDVAKQKSLGAVSGFQRANARVISIKIALQKSDVKISELEKKMSDVGGLTITECSQYLTKLDCVEDFAGTGLGAGPSCTWDEIQGVCS